MPLKIEAVKLFSRYIRTNITSGKSGGDLLKPGSGGGLRKIDKAGKLLKGKDDGGPLGWTWNGFTSLVGWTFSAAMGGVSWTWSATWGTIVGTINQVKSFNWNATDKQIETGINARNAQMAGIWGGVLGSGVGWLAGIGVGYGVAYLCPVIGGANLARVIAGSAGAEAVDELKSKLRTAVQQTATMLTATAANVVFINYRNFLRNADEGLLTTIYGKDTAKWIKDKWGKDGQPDISFNKYVDDTIEGLPGGQVVKSFVEEFLEESWDSFVEAGFVVAHQIDEAYQQAKLAASEAALGVDRSIEIILDKNAPDDTIAYSSVPEKLLIPLAQQSINTHRILRGKDIGEWVGEPFSEGLQSAQPQRRKLVLFFREAARPPYKQIGAGGKVVQITISDAKAGITWKQVKAACTSYTWGKCFAVGKFSNHRKMTVFAATKAEAKKQLLKFAELSEATLISLNTGEEDIKDIRLVKKPTEIYPNYCTLLYRKENTQGKVILDGKTFTEKNKKISLWETEPPPGKSLLDTW